VKSFKCDRVDAPPTATSVRRPAVKVEMAKTLDPGESHFQGANARNRGASSNQLLNLWDTLQLRVRHAFPMYGGNNGSIVISQNRSHGAMSLACVF